MLQGRLGPTVPSWHVRSAQPHSFTKLSPSIPIGGVGFLSAGTRVRKSSGQVLSTNMSDNPKMAEWEGKLGLKKPHPEGQRWVEPKREERTNGTFRGTRPNPDRKKDIVKNHTELLLTTDEGLRWKGRKDWTRK